MIIGILGNGTLAKTLNILLERAGHQIYRGTFADSIEETEGNDGVGTIASVFASNAEVFILATDFNALDEVATQYSGEITDRVLLDATNPVTIKTGDTAHKVQSAHYNASEYVATKFNTAHTAKALNILAPKALKENAFGTKAKMALPYAAQDEHSKGSTEKIIQSIGFDAVFVGNLGDTAIMDPKGKLFGFLGDKVDLLDILHKK